MDEETIWPVNTGAASIDIVDLPELEQKNIQASMLRLDKIHPVISGNKWFKLRYHLEHARKNQHAIIITYGGSYSNHIVATAYACKQQGFQSTGIIRGERPATLSHTLLTAEKYGMKLLFVTREAYAHKQDSEQIQRLLSNYTHPYIIPEGGSGEKGFMGSREIMHLSDFSRYTHILCCIGTGTMFTGLALSLSPGQQLTGIVVLKTEAQSIFLQSVYMTLEAYEIKNNCTILTGYHVGGYAKKSPQLLDFMNDFYKRTGIPTDFVYTGKLCYAFVQLTAEDYFPQGSNILLIHSGGLQGNRSLPARTLVF